jgi:hypothetical protein
MMVTLEEIMETFTEEDRREIDRLSDQLELEWQSLTELRRAVERAQASLGERLGVKQEDLSRLEQPSDLLLSTLSRYVAESGGKLSIVVEYPDRPPIALTDIRVSEDEYHDPDDADFELTSLPPDWHAFSEDKPADDDSQNAA